MNAPPAPVGSGHGPATDPKKRKSILWPDVSTLAGAKLATRLAFVVAILSSAVHVVFLVLLLTGVDWAPLKNFDAWSLLVNAAVSAAIAFGLRRQSRAAAATGLALYLAQRVIAWQGSSQGSGGLWTGTHVIEGVLTFAFISGVRGTWAYRRLTGSAASAA